MILATISYFFVHETVEYCNIYTHLPLTLQFSITALVRRNHLSFVQKNHVFNIIRIMFCGHSMLVYILRGKEIKEGEVIM